ncbi:Gfo/Idh/MocA family protein [Nonomuraea sp. NPDC003727]
MKGIKTISDLRLGALGFGLRGSLAREAHRPGVGALIAAVCDPSERARRRALEAFGEEVITVPAVESLVRLDLDGVLVLSPDRFHAEHAETLLEAGIPVYLEKPMAITVSDCDRVLATARRTGTKLYVGHNMRHMPLVLQMRELIQRGEIGEVKAVWCRHFVGHGGDFYFKDWHAERANTTGLLLQKGAHDIDVIHWLAGGYTRRVSGMGGLTLYGQITDRRDNSDRSMWDWYAPDAWPPRMQRELNPLIDVEDLSMINMELGNGVFATYQQCHYTPDYWRSYTVIGTEGRIENLGDGGDGSVIRLWNRRTDYNGEGDLTIPIRQESGGHGGADTAIITEFLRFISAGGPATTSPIAAREAVATGHTATLSLRGGGGALDVPPPSHMDIDYFEPDTSWERQPNG